MSFENTVKELRALLAQVTQDLEKSTLGNKAASQRVRTGTVKLEKIAKHFRKESIIAEKHGGGRGKQKAAKPAKKASATKMGNGTMALKSKAKPAAKPAAKAAAKPAAKKAAAPAKAKAAAAKPAARPMVGKAQTLNMKKPTAKLPARKPRSW